MPEISRFLGIVIAMYWDDHQPPHFHAKYGSFRMTVAIEDGAIEGDFPGRARGHVLEWLELHREELMEDWNLIRERQAPKPIVGLE
ncbi:MAG: DUF4160 domain-containing protein [Thermoanaerobaculia bacterium]